MEKSFSQTQWFSEPHKPRVLRTQHGSSEPARNAQIIRRPPGPKTGRDGVDEEEEEEEDEDEEAEEAEEEAEEDAEEEEEAQYKLVAAVQGFPLTPAQVWFLGNAIRREQELRRP